MLIFQSAIDARTRCIVKGIGDHLTEAGRLRKIESLCKHLRDYPQAKGVAVKVSYLMNFFFIFFINVFRA